MKGLLSTVLLAALVSMLCFAHTASAQPTDDSVATCLSAYEAAQIAAREARLLAAMESGRQCAMATCPRLIQNDCLQLVERVDGIVPRISFAVRDGHGVDRLDAKIFVDDKLVASGVNARLLPVDPGNRRIRAVLPEGEASVDVFLREGERPKLIDLALPQIDTPEGPFRVPVASWVVGSVGLASLTAGAILGGIAYAEFSDANDTCGRSGCPEETRNSVSTKAIAADVTLGVGAGLLVTAVIVALATGRETPVSVKAQASLSSAGLGLEWTY